MSPEIYRLLHVVGVLMLFVGLGGALATPGRDGGKVWLTLHGIGLLVMLVAGIGVLHKAGLAFEGWVIAKIACWVLLGMLPFMVRRGVLPRLVALLFVLGIGAAAAWLGQTKPF